MSFTFFDSMYKWDHAVFFFLCLVYFTWHNALQIHSCCCKCILSFPFCGWIYYIVYIYSFTIYRPVILVISFLKCSDKQVIYISHFLYSFVGGHLSCFYNLATMNIAAKNIRVQIHTPCSAVCFSLSPSPWFMLSLSLSVACSLSNK